MTEQRKTLFTDLAIGLALCVAVVAGNWSSGFPLFHLLCDGFFAAAVLLLCSGLLIFCGNQGAFDMMGYGVRSVVGLIVRSFEPQTDYFTYCKEKHEEKKPCGHLLIAGLIHLALSAVCMVIYSVTG